MNLKFEPTIEQIELAQDYFIALAYRDVVKETFSKWEESMLTAGTFRYNDKYTHPSNERTRLIPADGIIRDPKDVFLMAGIDAYGTPSYEGSDAQLYYDILRKIAAEHGFIHGENALARAEIDLTNAERAFIEGTQSIHRIPLEKLTMHEHWKRIIKLLSAMFAAIVKNERLEQKQAAFFSERQTQPIS